MVLYLDILMTILQMIVLLSWGNSCFSKRCKDNLINKILKVALMTMVIEVIYMLVNNGALNNIITCIVVFFFIQIIYKSNMRNASIFALIYVLFMTVPTIIIVTLQQMIKVMSDIDFTRVFGMKTSAIIIYIYGSICLIVYLRYKNSFINMFKIISKARCGRNIMLVAIILENILYLCIGENSIEIRWNVVAYNIIFLVYLITIIFILAHIAKIKRQETIIDKLNDTLLVKNNELSKIKHDYGAQISYLYGLYLLKRYDELKKEIKKIKKRNENTVSAVEINYSKVRKISDGLNKLLDKGVHLIIHEYGEIDNISISKKELLRLLEEISNCIIETSNKHNFILIKTYNEFGKLRIEMKSSQNKSDLEIIEERVISKLCKRDFGAETILENKFKRLEEQFNKKVKIIYKYTFITEVLKVSIIIK